MPRCIPFRDGTGIGIICVRSGPAPKIPPCFHCGNIAPRLCDYPVTRRRLCNRPLCVDCASSEGPNVDFCLDHRSSKLI